MKKRVLKYYYTIKHLKLIQFYGRALFCFKKPRINHSMPPLPRVIQGKWTSPIFKSAKTDGAYKVIFLNQARDIADPSAWTTSYVDMLWLYHLHYFDVINNASTNSEWSAALIERWIRENPPAIGCGWDSYPISLRIVNWIKWVLTSNQLSASMLHSLAIQIRYLMKRFEIHLLGNHLLANAKALIFAGLFFAGQEGEKWLKKGLSLFQQQLQEQILLDGGHFELSPMYHSIILEDLLDVFNLLKTYGHPIPQFWLSTCEKMFCWLESMCHLDNNVAFFNDTTLGVAPTLNELKIYQHRLQLPFQTKASKKSAAIQPLLLSESGYCRIQTNSLLLLADVGKIGASYQPGHGHADTLSFELSIGKYRVLVNSGTSTYADNTERLRQRGSKAHNTIVIDDCNSSEIWKSFRVGRRARVTNITTDFINGEFCLKATHDGYSRIDQIYHNRKWRMQDRKLTIEDEVLGIGQHKVELHFHIHPDIQIDIVNDTSLKLYHYLHGVLGMFETSEKLQVLNSTYHPAFNVSIPAKKIVVVLQKRLPANVITSIEAIL